MNRTLSVRIWDAHPYEVRGKDEDKITYVICCILRRTTTSSTVDLFKIP